MRFICLGYRDEAHWDALPEIDRTSYLEECSAYDDELRRGGHYLEGEALQDIRKAATLRYRGGEVTVTGGPCTLNREQLGGILFLEARDLNHAIQLMSQHPGIRCGTFEIRPVGR